MTSLVAPFRPKSNPKLHYLSLLGAVTCVSLSLWLGDQDWSQHTSLKLGWLSIVQYSLLAVFMLISWATSARSNDYLDYKWLIVAAIFIRVILIPVEPYTSNDIDRYLFDGKVAISGFDPYRIAHDAEPLEALRQSWQPPAEHASYVTLYPPAALALFSLSASMGLDYAVLTWKTLVTLASLGTLALMLLVLKKCALLRHIPFIALSPILILEAGVGAHVDAFSALAVSAALYCWLNKRIVLTGVSIALGALCKMLPILLLAPLVMSVFNLRQASRLIFGTVVTLIAGYGLAFSVGLQPIGSLATFFQKWRNGSPLFNFLESYLAAPLLLPSIILLALTSLLAVCYLSWKSSKQQKNSLLNGRTLQWALAIPLLLSPVVFPWYLMPLVPLFAVLPNAFLLLWLVLLPLSYEVQNEFACCGIWAPQSWPITVLGIGMLIGLVIDNVRTSSAALGVKSHS